MSSPRSSNLDRVLSTLAITRNQIDAVRRRFASDERGNVAMIFGLMTVVIVAMVGGAVDYGRWMSARYQTQNAVDAALLAAGRTSQTSYGDATKAVAAANAYYAQMKSPLVVDDTVAFSSVNSATSFEVKGTAYVETPFLSIVQIERLPVFNTGEVVHSKSTIAQGGNSGSSVEIGLMLDTTGSMSGQKIIDLKAAANDLVNIVVWDDQGTYTSRIGIAPFSEGVNVGDYFQTVTNINPVGASHQETVIDHYNDVYGYVYPDSCFVTTSKTKKGVTTYTTTNTCLNQSQYYVLISHTPVYKTKTIVDNVAKATCVVERTGTDEFTDTVPGPGAWIKDYNSAAGTTSTTCPEAASIVPLTSDKSVLHAKIDSLVAQNSTAGAVGTAWAWYLISPNWSTIFTGDAAPASYSKLTELGPSGQPRLQKIAILMTDGAYNTWQGNGASTSTVNSKALSLCSGMKAKGIKVYTVGFDLGTDTTAKNMLKSCATDATYFYDAASGDALKQAFRDIALKISALRISH